MFFWHLSTLKSNEIQEYRRLRISCSSICSIFENLKIGRDVHWPHIPASEGLDSPRCSWMPQGCLQNGCPTSSKSLVPWTWPFISPFSELLSYSPSSPSLEIWLFYLFLFHVQGCPGLLDAWSQIFMLLPGRSMYQPWHLRFLHRALRIILCRFSGSLRQSHPPAMFEKHPKSWLNQTAPIPWLQNMSMCFYPLHPPRFLRGV